jgi:TolA-binding protein
MVIAHRSTAINFAVLFRKPVMITATRETYEHNSQTPFLDAVAGSLGQTIQFFNQAGDVDLASSYEMDEGIYQQFVEDYIKSKISPSAPFWDLVVNHVNDSGVAAI